MKKIIFGVIFLLAMQSTVLAEKQLDYSLMAAPLEETVEYIGDLTELDEQNGENGLNVCISVADLSAGAEQTWEEEFYAQLDSVYKPENLVNQKLTTFSDGSYGLAAPEVAFDLDTSLGDLKAQAGVRAAQLNEVAVRYISDNPEYFYLSPRSYGYSAKTQNGKLIVTFIQIIAKDFPEFDGTQAALAGLKAKYEELASEINKIKKEIYFEGMTELDKLVLAHDYIISNSAYYRIDNKENNTVDYGDGYSYNAYGILVNKKGVCQGLSYAYPCVLKALGYPIEDVRQIRSSEMAHMWNFVKLGNRWYHVDLTWDDPLYQSSATGKYDMNDESAQHEIHDYLLISNKKNTECRNEAGYSSFSLEVIGADGLRPDAASDTTFEAGYFFNDPVDNNSNGIPGRVEYADGAYRKYYLNSGVYFMNDTLKAPKYIVSQPAYNQNGIPIVYIFGSKQRNKPNEKITQYIVSYKNERFLQASSGIYSLTGFGMIRLNGYSEPTDGTTIKIITVASDFTPVANVAVIK